MTFETVKNVSTSPKIADKAIELLASESSIDQSGFSPKEVGDSEVFIELKSNCVLQEGAQLARAFRAMGGGRILSTVWVKPHSSITIAVPFAILSEDGHSMPNISGEVKAEIHSVGRFDEPEAAQC